ncbi:MAG: hypothetical protein ACREQI_02865 [Candidatus Binataceae bacterium]
MSKAIQSNQDPPESCIYLKPTGLCSGNSPLNDEHYLPRELGNFRGYEELRNKICKACNDRFGKLDEFIVRFGPEIFQRIGHGIEGRKKHRKKDPFHEPTHGRAPVEINAVLPNEQSPVPLEILPGNRARPRRELIFQSACSARITVPIPHRVDTEAKLDQLLNRAGVAAQPLVEINCAADDAQFIALIERRFGRTAPVGRPPDQSGYPLNVPAESSIKLPPEYHRAIAKIGFHFFVWCFSQSMSITGRESAFNEIKQFIYSGGNPKKFIACRPIKIERERSGIPWAHVLEGEWAGDEMIATVQLFAGSDLGMGFEIGDKTTNKFSGNFKDVVLAWRVRLGRTSLAYTARRAFAFIGYNTRRDGFDGYVKEVRVG